MLIFTHTFSWTRTVLMAVAMMLVTGQVLAANTSGPAPDFTLKSRSGENIKLSELRGQVVMINFWASWCGPCRQEMPILDQLYQRYEPMGFTLLGVNVEEDSAAAEKVLREIPVSFPVLYDSKNQVSENYQVRAMPSTFLIDRDGKVRYLHKGYKPGYEDEYQQQVRELIRE
ncbi:MAG: TlpA family protein disulfide reductase [Candidatus Thiodiazotropha sp. (ex Semelilucina semeliformis)]|nr:TlpA family protein disulfide reductase [Candidatus Thiodiazotropha sp. (ex Myrtea spinifera)]MCU7808150.1 TlpA family protein disulfide reductase [Candidatus Thiodiazotropha sp. (ex Semelilucina semeliformis)]MCU7827597.1 TlpA family protein disulfide reductase [Candidatus Thiodiazotropha sp. (ex Myrtea sp. 'scaly one' KF741663)]